MLMYELYRETLQKNPEKTAIICNEKTCTYKELDERVKNFAFTLMDKGIKKGDRVALFMHNSIEIIELYFACFRIGAIAVPISVLYKEPEIIYAANHCQCKMLIAGKDDYATVKNIKHSVPSLEKILAIGSSWDESIKEWHKEAECPSVETDDPAVILYTSGSTDRPKGVTHTNSSLFNSAINKSAAMEIEESDMVIIGTYLCHVSGLIGTAIPALYRGATILIITTSTPGIYLNLIEKYRVTHALTLPVQLQELLDHPLSRKTDFTSIKYMLCGGDALTDHLRKLFFEVTGFELSEGFGATECEGFMINPRGKTKRGSMGLPIPGTEVRLIDGKGNDVMKGDTGEILVKSKALMAGYWNDPENTGKSIIDGWYHTGDLARQDEDGYYYFTGRIKQMIVHCGGNMSPGEVENAINEHPGVKMSGVAGIRDGVSGQSVLAFIVPDKSRNNIPDEKELKTFISEKLSDYKVPEHWKFVDKLPLNAMGKIDRRKLNEIAEQYNCSVT